MVRDCWRSLFTRHYHPVSSSWRTTPALSIESRPLADISILLLRVSRVNASAFHHAVNFSALTSLGERSKETRLHFLRHWVLRAFTEENRVPTGGGRGIKKKKREGQSFFSRSKIFCSDRFLEYQPVVYQFEVTLRRRDRSRRERLKRRDYL